MDDLFLLKLVLSFLVGGLYIAFIVRLSERVSASMGGVLAGMPSTVLISIIFIWWVQGTEGVLEAVSIIPIGLGACQAFFFVLLAVYKKNKFMAFTGALFTWLGILYFFIAKEYGFWVYLPLSVLMTVSALLYFNKFPDRKADRFALSRGEFLFRVCLAGSVISASVLLSRVLGPIWGGMMASFPAAGLSMTVILVRKHGIDFVYPVVKGGIYGVISNLGFLAMLFILASIMSFLASLAVAYLSSFVVAFSLYFLFLRRA